MKSPAWSRWMSHLVDIYTGGGAPGAGLGAAGRGADLGGAAGPPLPAVRYGGGDDDWAPGTSGTVGRSSGGHDTVDIWTVTVRVMYGPSRSCMDRHGHVWTVTVMYGRVKLARMQVMAGWVVQSSVQEEGRGRGRKDLETEPN